MSGTPATDPPADGHPMEIDPVFPPPKTAEKAPSKNPIGRFLKLFNKNHKSTVHASGTSQMNNRSSVLDST
ncbi:hypothetical protein CRE_02543 [Caenorhabditis remanei]|uniref:Uncharacterized protein n=2 Tax=Caenorhabditis remanei TaxID=31234 RepID=E3MWU6_CAERE|nr:hypothetical protein CRE_02543 [Caenorhabditis remanei]